MNITLALPFIWLFGFYGNSIFVGHLTPNPCFMQIVLFQTIQFSMSTQFNCQKHLVYHLFIILQITFFFYLPTRNWGASYTQSNLVIYIYFFFFFFFLTVPRRKQRLFIRIRCKQSTHRGQH